MGKRGRPSKNGLQPCWMFHRVLLVLHAYNEGRSSPLKHSAAVREAVETVTKTYPSMPISETEVRRILAQFQPKGVRVAFKVARPSVSEKTLPPGVCALMGIPEGKKVKITFTFGYGPRPEYPRFNLE